MTFLGQDKPSLEETLEHHGVKGMKWGVRRDASARADAAGVKQQLKTQRIDNRAAVRDHARAHTTQNPNDKQIMDARKAQQAHADNVYRAHAQYKADKARYRADKEKIGKVQAKIILEKNGKLSLQKAQAARDANATTAAHETSSEAVNRLIRQVLGLPTA